MNVYIVLNAEGELARAIAFHSYADARAWIRAEADYCGFDPGEAEDAWSIETLKLHPPIER